VFAMTEKKGFVNASLNKHLLKKLNSIIDNYETSKIEFKSLVLDV